jgi:hypothetical protein
MASDFSQGAAEKGPQDASCVDARSVGLARASEEARLQHDREWIASLGQQWRSHHGQDLRLRYDTGKTLNDRLGPPTSRLPRGEGVMGLLAEQTGLSESSLNRMRWFAFRFSTYEEFKASQSDVDSWEKVCVLLVEISHKEKTAEAASNGSAKPAEPGKEVQAILRSLKAVARAMPVEQVPVDEDVFDDIDAGLRKFRRALKRCTGLNVTISIASAAESITS